MILIKFWSLGVFKGLLPCPCVKDSYSLYNPEKQMLKYGWKLGVV